MKDKTEIIIQGRLDKKRMNRFEGVEVSNIGETRVLTGNLKDKAHKHGI